MKYSIFFYEGNMESSALKESLIREVAAAYCLREGIGFNGEDAVILREEKGKPYFEGLPVHFNVSHSENMWIMIIGGAPCGIDIQAMKDCDCGGIAARYFSRAEQEFAEQMGPAGFFALWTRREAYGKYTGQGFFGEMPSFVDGEGMLVEAAGGAYVRPISVGYDVFCAYCTGGCDDEIEFFG